MGFLGLPDYEGPVTAWRNNKDRGNIEIGKEGSAFMDAELSKPSPHTRTPEGPEFADGDSRPGIAGWILGGVDRDRDRDDERERG